MSSFDILERYNDYSTDLLSDNPRMRANAIRKMMELYRIAPELKLSILTKLAQLAEDKDENVARLAAQMVKIIESGKQYSPYYPTPTPSTTSRPATTARPPQNVKNVVANVVCCVIFIIIYFVLTYTVF